MGKRYYCDYCDKTMVATPSIIRIHNSGAAHQKLVNDHYQHFKHPETIIAEESIKKPCMRYGKGECPFGSICRFSHYSQEDINALREFVTKKNHNEINMTQPSFEDLYEKFREEKSCNLNKNVLNETILCDSNGVTHTLPWCYNVELENYGNIPPSIQQIDVESFVNANISEWG